MKYATTPVTRFGVATSRSDLRQTARTCDQVSGARGRSQRRSAPYGCGTGPLGSQRLRALRSRELAELIGAVAPRRLPVVRRCGVSRVGRLALGSPET